MWTSTVGLVNGKYRYLTAETFGFKINSNGQQLKRRQQWTIEPFPENTGPDGSISSAASVSSQCPVPNTPILASSQQAIDPNDPCILTLGGHFIASSMTSVKSSSNGSSSSDQEGCGEEHENVAIKSHLNKYLAVDSFGNVTCDSDEKTENARFTITICSMSQGRSKDEHIFWAFKNVERGYYLGTTDDGMICCSAKMPKSRAELWHLHLLPARGSSFFAIKSLGRKRFARVTNVDGMPTARHDSSSSSDASYQVQLDANISWGSETLFQFKYYDGGKYALLTSDNKLLTNEGKCASWHEANENSLPPPECLFTLEYHSGYLAFRDSFSQYLAAAGRSSILRSRSIGVSRDELFVFEGVPIQVSLKATFNNRWVSIKQGVDLSANQMDTSTRFETFQLTYHKQTQLWSVMTYDCNFWTISQNTNTVSVCRPGDYEGLTRGQFKLIWSNKDPTFSLKYVDISRQERWIAARKSGQLYLGSSSHEPVKFIMRFQNRRLLNLRPVEGSGFVGLKSVASKQLEANKTSPDSIAIEYSEPSQVNGNQIATQHVAKTDGTNLLSNEQNVINVFNVKLNSTKLGQTVLDKLHNGGEIATAKSKQPQGETTSMASGLIDNQKELDCGIDANNNYMESEYDRLEESKGESVDGGGVESVSTPSVASIISSFSNAKIVNTGSSASQHCQTTVMKASNAGTTVSKLASSFEHPQSSNASNTVVETTNDASSIINSSNSSEVSSTSPGSATTICQLELNGDSSKNGTTVEHPISTECCHMKIIANGKYLHVNEGDSSLICDVSSKTDAQTWILELRSHSSLAIRASDSQAYLQLGTNGTIFLSRCEAVDASLWEF